MKDIVYVLICFISATGIALAAVETPLYGETPDGWEILVDLEAYPNSDITITRKGDGVGKSLTVFKEEHCHFSYESVKKNNLPPFIPIFFCPRTAKSPLAGTKYIGHPYDKSTCKEDDPFYVYVCVSGCETNKRAPKKLYQDSYEGKNCE